MGGRGNDGKVDMGLGEVKREGQGDGTEGENQRGREWQQQDAGFGSQEGEGSIDGGPMRPARLSASSSD
ncbi:unnamed protein product [Coregonus sp. 'balchen']|nr:unnamed protein product [Coregonus sp. 'balchen']